jgi:hypothetical protein
MQQAWFLSVAIPEVTEADKSTVGAWLLIAPILKFPLKEVAVLNKL